MHKTNISNIVATASTSQVIITTSFTTSELKYLTRNTKDSGNVLAVQDGKNKM
jgi:hypothetical protein